MEDQVDLDVMRRVMGDAFSVGARKVVKTGDGMAASRCRQVECGLDSHQRRDAAYHCSLR